MKKTLSILCVSALLIPLLVCVVSAAPVAFDSSNYSEYVKEYNSGAKDYTYNFDKEQYYNFGLWSGEAGDNPNYWGTKLGDFSNESPTFQTDLLSARIRPFGNNQSAIDIGHTVGHTVTNGYYFNIANQLISTFTFDFGFYLRDVNGSGEPYGAGAKGNYYLYFIDKDFKVIKKTSNSFTYEIDMYPQTSTQYFHKQISVTIDYGSLPKETIGFVPVYTVRNLDMNNISGYRYFMFFPNFQFSYQTSFLQGVTSSIMDFRDLESGVISGFSGFVNYFRSLVQQFSESFSALGGANGVVNEIVNLINSLPFVSILLTASLILGSTGAIFGLVVGFVGKNMSTNAEYEKQRLRYDSYREGHIRGFNSGRNYERGKK